MIIKRLAQGMRSQDWFTVGVEIVIVVVGIFIGLQVDDWNEDRKKKADLDVYLSRIAQEASLSRERIEAQLEYTETILASLNYIVTLLDSTDDASFDLEKVGHGLRDAWYLPQLTTDMTILREYSESGISVVLTDDAKRQAIRNWLGFDEFMEEQFHSIRDTNSVDFFSPSIVRFAQDGDHNLIIISFDLQAARSDPLFRQQVNLAWRQQMRWFNARRSYVGLLRHVEDALKD